MQRPALPAARRLCPAQQSDVSLCLTRVHAPHPGDLLRAGRSCQDALKSWLQHTRKLLVACCPHCPACPACRVSFLACPLPACLARLAAGRLVERIQEAGSSGQAFDVHQLLGRMTMQVIGRAAFG